MMNPIANALMAAMLASSLVSAAVIGTPARREILPLGLAKREMTCTATLTGVNSEGGGGPGQAPINNNQFGYTTGATGNSNTVSDGCTQGTGSDISCPTIDKSAYLGTYDTTCSGEWDFFNNSWSSCTCNGVGGTIAPSTISSGTVSETTDTCTVTYDC